MNEPIHPPRGYCIGFRDAMIGPFATEAEARQALADAVIFVVGQPAGWHEQCGATHFALVCTLPRGEHEWHDNGGVAWPAYEVTDEDSTKTGDVTP